MVYINNIRFLTIAIAYCEMAIISCAHSLGHRSIYKSNKLCVFLTYINEVMHSGLCGPRNINVYKDMKYEDTFKDVASDHGYWSAEHPIMHHLFVNKENDMEGSAKNTIEGNLPFTDIHAVKLWKHSKKSRIHKYQHYLWLVYAIYYRFTKFIRINFYLVPKKIQNICKTIKIKKTWQEKYQILIMLCIALPKIFIVYISVYNSFKNFILNVLYYSLAFELLVGFQTTLWSLHKIETKWMEKQTIESESWLEMQLQTVSYWIKPYAFVNNIIFNGFFGYHIEHHMFPRLNWLYLSYIAPIVKEYLIKNEYEYKEEKLSIIGFPIINKEYIRMLSSYKDL